MRAASLFFALSCLASASAMASNEIRVSAPIKGGSSWQDIASEISDWANVGPASNCAAGVPAASEFSAGTSFTQTFSGCTQAQSRTISQMTQNPVTGETKVVSQTTEERVLSDYSYSKQASGTSNKVCQYSLEGSSTYSWVEGAQHQSDQATYGIQLRWNGVVSGQTFYSAPINTFFDHLDKDGYRYTRGAYRESAVMNELKQVYYFNYAICREPL